MAIKGDFISFTYNGVHSTDLGVVHVSTSDRYTDALLPTIQDKTVQVPGGDGTYFFGSYYTQRQFTISIAFDEVTEDKIRLMRQKWGDKQSHELIFDEEPYKVYYAKVSGTPQLTYIPFSSPGVYKGEGTYTFICYDPFAHTPNDYKYLNQWVPDHYVYSSVTINENTFNSNKSNYFIKVNDNYIQCTEDSAYDSEETYYTRAFVSGVPSSFKYDHKTEWNLSAKLLTVQGNYDTYTNNKFMLYNPGDLEAEFKFKVPFSSGNITLNGIKISKGNDDLASHTLTVNGPITAKGSDAYLLFNSKTNIIEGLDAQGGRTMNLYNEYIQSGHWFKIPVTEGNISWYFVPIDYSGSAPSLKYDYLYF